MKTKYKNKNQFKTLIKTSNDTKRENSFLHCSNKKIQDENLLNCHNRLSRNVLARLINLQYYLISQ